jgi:hypothetical protein
MPLPCAPRANETRTHYLELMEYGQCFRLCTTPTINAVCGQVFHAPAAQAPKNLPLSRHALPGPRELAESIGLIAKLTNAQIRPTVAITSTNAIVVYQR